MAKNSFAAEVTFKGCKMRTVLLGDEQSFEREMSKRGDQI